MKKVFISYAKEDKGAASKLFKDLKNVDGILPWIDTHNLLPGQNWQRKITQSINESNYFIALISKKSINKRGYVQKELRQAIEVAKLIPEDQIFIIPIRLENCVINYLELDKLHYINLFDSYDEGFKKVVQAIGLDKLKIEDLPKISEPLLNDFKYTSFTEFINDMHFKDKKDILEMLLKIEKKSYNLFHFINNLRLECHLPITLYKELVELLDKHKSKEHSVIEQIVIRYCLENQLMGEVIETSENQEFLFSTPIGRFKDYLQYRYYERFTSNEDVELFIMSLIHEDTLISNKTLSQIKFKDDYKSIWCTFSPENKELLGDLYKTANDFRAFMGYSYSVHKYENYLAFVYNLPQNINLCYPTVLDGIFDLNFRPAPPTSNYGLTTPWSSNKNLIPQPEGIHNSISLNNLKEVKLLYSI